MMFTCLVLLGREDVQVQAFIAIVASPPSIEEATVKSFRSQTNFPLWPVRSLSILQSSWFETCPLL